MGLCMVDLNFRFSYTYLPATEGLRIWAAVFAALYCVQTELLKYAVGPSYISRLAQKKTGFKLKGHLYIESIRMVSPMGSLEIEHIL